MNAIRKFQEFCQDASTALGYMYRVVRRVQEADRTLRELGLGTPRRDLSAWVDVLGVHMQAVGDALRDECVETIARAAREEEGTP